MFVLRLFAEDKLLRDGVAWLLKQMTDSILAAILDAWVERLTKLI